LTKVIIGYLKAQAINEPKSYSDISKISNVSAGNVRLNGSFLVSIGILEGQRGDYKLTAEGRKYAQALDWGRFEEANYVLRELLKATKLMQAVTGFIDINKPVDKEDLISQIAVIAGVSKESRLKTGTKAYVDMLITCGLLKEDAEGKIYPGKYLEPSEQKTSTEMYLPETPIKAEKTRAETRFAVPITLSFVIDNQTDEERLRKLLKVIKEVFSEE
jgi:hypothetical protein